MAAEHNLDAQGTSRFIAFFDECGDHSMDHIDRDFPLFLLSTVIVKREHYSHIIIPTIAELKLKYWDHEGINLHSRDIRKAEGPYRFLQHPERRQRFLGDVKSLIENIQFTLFVSAIRKDKHFERSGKNAANPYTLAVTYTFERILHFLKWRGETRLPVIAEGRGNREDRELEHAYFQLLGRGTGFHAPEEFRGLDCPLVFKRKEENICGIQLADLCAYPSARNILKPTQPNQAFEIVQKHIYENAGVRGWKIFP